MDLKKIKALKKDFIDLIILKFVEFQWKNMTTGPTKNLKKYSQQNMKEKS